MNEWILYLLRSAFFPFLAHPLPVASIPFWPYLFSLLSHCAVLQHLYYLIIYLALFLFPVRHGSCFRATFFPLTFVSFSYSAYALAQPGSFWSLLLKFSNPCSIIPKLTWYMLFSVYKKITIATGHLLHNLTSKGKQWKMKCVLKSKEGKDRTGQESLVQACGILLWYIIYDKS